MKKNLGVIAFAVTILTSIYTISFSPNISGTLTSFILAALTSVILFLEKESPSDNVNQNEESIKLKQELEVEQIKANLERLKYQNVQDQVKRDELSAQNKTESKYFF